MSSNYQQMMGPRVFLLAVVAALLAGSAMADLPPGAVPHQLVLKLGPDKKIGPINDEHDTSTLASLPSHNTHLIGLPPQMSEKGLLNILAVNQNVEWVEFNFSLGVTGGGSQSFFFSSIYADFIDQYAFELLEIDEVQQIALGDGIIVAVVDTGVDDEHELLQGRVLDNGYDFINMTNGAGVTPNPTGPLAGHGTFMAGLVAHIAPGAMLLPVKVLDDDGTGDAFYAAAGILYAVDHGAQVINASFGTTIDTQIMRHAVQQAKDAGVLVVAAAGNENMDDPVQYPAADDHALSVAATDQGDIKALFSNFGSHIDLTAPGYQVVSALPGNEYGVANGSSMSAALASAVTAIIRSAHPSLSPQALQEKLAEAALNIDGLNPGYAGLLGTGRLRALEALSANSKVGDLTGDGQVGVADLLILLSSWGECDDCEECIADLDNDCNVGVADLLILLANWG